MRQVALTVVLGLLLSGCGSHRSALRSPTATPRPVVAPPTPKRTPTPKPAPAPVDTSSQPYRAFLGSLCTALAQEDAGTVINDLPYYEYNSGTRYGFLGDGEGQTGDPSIVRTWLAADHVRCVYFTPDLAGHGVLLTRGWSQPGGPWNLVEMDTYNGHWKINDFTFGRRADLWRAMQVARPIFRYRR